jgi:hypothetical protein
MMRNRKITPRDYEDVKHSPRYTSRGGPLLLEDGQLVTLDPEKGIVYKGSVGTDEEMIPTVCVDE